MAEVGLEDERPLCGDGAEEAQIAGHPTIGGRDARLPEQARGDDLVLNRGATWVRVQHTRPLVMKHARQAE